MAQHYDRPIPPHDRDLQYAIEQMAEYVAQYGPEAEEKARVEHHNNPQYAFLFGGRHGDYYQHCLRVNWDRGQSSHPPAPPVNTQQMEEIQQITNRLEQLRREIAESEMNLKAQEESIPMQKELEFGKQVALAEEQKISTYLANVKLDISPFIEVLTQLNNPKASKDNIGNCKKWILDHCLTDQQREVILTYLLSKVKDMQSSDCFRLNILYLINDWAHYCQRKKLDSITQMLSRYVPQMYAFTVESSNDPALQPKLEKLIGVWEGSKYFSDQCFKQLRNPSNIFTTAKNAIFAEYAKIASNLDMQFQALFAGYEQQHLNFVRHNSQQVAQLENQLHQIHNGTQGSLQPSSSGQRRSRFDQQTRLEEPSGLGRYFPPAPVGSMEESWGEPPLVADGDDIDGHPYAEETLIPNTAYYNLPAAIIVPQIPFENMTYQAIDPASLRLPPPIPPSQRLIDALDAFYLRPTTLDAQGWEENSLADFYDRKLRLKKIMQEKLSGEGKTFEDIINNRPTTADIKLQAADREALIAKIKKEMRERDSRRKIRPQSRSESPSRSRSRSGSSRSSRSRSSSRSRRSPKKRSRSRSLSPRSSRSRSHSPRRPFLREKSLSPLGFGRPSFVASSAPLGDDNKGAMLMAKMGWGGKGLGAKESGIVEPITGGDVRDKSEMFRGLGSKSDPYEQFRKMRSGNYHDKNHLAAEERERERRNIL